MAAEFWFLGIHANRSQAALPEPALEMEPKSRPVLNVPVPKAEKTQAEDGKLAAALARTSLLLETLGAWSASQVYQSYLNIGMLADAVAHQAYA
jgi:hypothetical protein